MKTILLTDSCCDLPLTYVKENSENIEIIGMPINIGADNFLDDLGDQNYDHPEFIISCAQVFGEDRSNYTC